MNRSCLASSNVNENLLRNNEPFAVQSAPTSATDGMDVDGQCARFLITEYVEEVNVKPLFSQLQNANCRTRDIDLAEECRIASALRGLHCCSSQSQTIESQADILAAHKRLGEGARSARDRRRRALLRQTISMAMSDPFFGRVGQWGQFFPFRWDFFTLVEDGRSAEEKLITRPNLERGGRDTSRCTPRQGD